MAGELWGLCRRRWVRDTKPGMPRSGSGELVEGGDASGGAAIGVRGEWSCPHVAVLAPRRIAAASADNEILTGAQGVRCWRAGPVGMPMHHELSFQEDVRRGGDRGNVARVIIVPPQQGQRSNANGMAASSTGTADGLGGRTSSSFRQSSSFAARRPLARKP